MNSDQAIAYVNYWAAKRLSVEERKLLFAQSHLDVVHQMRAIIVKQFGGDYSLTNLDEAYAQVRDQLYPAVSEPAPTVSQEEIAKRRLEREGEQRREDNRRNLAGQNKSELNSLADAARGVRQTIDEAHQAAAKKAAEEVTSSAAIYRNGRVVHSATQRLREELGQVFVFSDQAKTVISWPDTVALRRTLLRKAQTDPARQAW